MKLLQRLFGTPKPALQQSVVSGSFKDVNELRAFRNYIEAFACLPKHFIEIHTDKAGKLRIYHADNEYQANDGIAPNRIVDSGLIHGKICWMCLV